VRSYIIKKILLVIPLLFGITLITFTLTKALPGDPVYSLVGQRASEDTIKMMRRELGVDRGIMRQYIGYLSLLMKGELGRSYYTQRRVMDDIIDKFPNTIRLAFGAMLIATPFGILLGFVSALKRNSMTDKVISGMSVTGLSIPVFWSGLILMLFFSLKMKVLPPSGTGNIRYLILPALTLAVTILDILPMPYVRTARAKGVRESQINTVHILKNALIPIITIIGLEFGSYLNGAVLTETIFGWDGIGRFTMEGIIKRDYPVIMGCILVGTIVFILINVVVDVLYHYIDPRVRVHGTDR
jgi:ABC-type dipeptide/oligopeptide/nickel transport system permease component